MKDDIPALEKFFRDYPEGEENDLQSPLSKKVYELAKEYGLETILKALQVYYEEKASIQPQCIEGATWERFYLKQADKIEQWLGELMERRTLGGDH